MKAPFEGGGQPAGSNNGADGVQREEKEDIKVVDGQPVRVVEGSFSYKSPEGLPVSVKYVHSFILFILFLSILFFFFFYFSYFLSLTLLSLTFLFPYTETIEINCPCFVIFRRFN